MADENAKRAIYAVQRLAADYIATATAFNQGRATAEEVQEALRRYQEAAANSVQGSSQGGRGKKRTAKKARSLRKKTRGRKH
jgi:deoxyribose-phosphate aldolase